MLCKNLFLYVLIQRLIAISIIRASKNMSLWKCPRIPSTCKRDAGVVKPPNLVLLPNECVQSIARRAIFHVLLPGFRCEILSLLNVQSKKYTTKEIPQRIPAPRRHRNSTSNALSSRVSTSFYIKKKSILRLHRSRLHSLKIASLADFSLLANERSLGEAPERFSLAHFHSRRGQSWIEPKSKQRG